MKEEMKSSEDPIKTKNEKPLDLGNDKKLQSKELDKKNISDENFIHNKELNSSLIELALVELSNERNSLIDEIKDLEKRKSKIDLELKNSFLGQSDSIARKLKGFQDYLSGALHDLAQSAEQLDLVKQPLSVKPSPLDEIEKPQQPEELTPAIADTFKQDEGLIKDCLEQFLDQPDFYAEPWKFRRSLDVDDANLISDWFFSMGGRGAQPSRGNRSKNILITAAIISIIGEIYGDRFQTLILASQPERLGEWRRGLQDALGLGREDFGPNSGIVLFERGEGVIEKADRLEESEDVPLIIVDSCELSVEIPILQFPIWLAFAASQKEIYAEENML